jgi:hypothetical protein
MRWTDLIDADKYTILPHLDASLHPVVIREELHQSNRFIYFHDVASFVNVYDQLYGQGQVHWHEVIAPNRIQRVRFDLDISGEEFDLEDVFERIYEFITHIIQTCIGVYDNDYAGPTIKEDDFYVLSANSAGGILPPIPPVNGTHTDGGILPPTPPVHPSPPVNKPGKLSYHIITPIWFRSVVGCKEFTNLVQTILLVRPGGFEDLLGVIDRQVTKSNQSFRLPGSSKIRSERIKLPCADWHGEGFKDHWINFMVGHYGSGTPNLLPQGTSGTRSLTGNAIEHRAKTDVIVALLRNRITDFDLTWKVRSDAAKCVTFTRLKASRCELCDKDHISDNTLYVRIGQPQGGKSIVSMRCYRTTASEELGSIEAKAITEAHFDRLKRYNLDADSDKINEEKNLLYNALRQQRFDGSDMQIFNNPILEPFPDCRTLFVRAPMKMGKTKQMIELIKRKAKEDFRCVIVSFRQTFTASIQSVLNHSELDFELYNEIPSGRIRIEEHPLLIIQVESLHRLDFDRIDMFVVDESESVLSQFSSPHIFDLRLTYSKFQSALMLSRQVICMDANLSARTIKIVCPLRRRAKGIEVGVMPNKIYYENLYQNAEEDMYYVHPTLQQLYGSMHKALLDGKKVFCCSTSLNDAKVILQLIREQFTIDCVTGVRTEGDVDLKVAFYSSEMSPTIRTDHLGRVNEVWKEVDVLIYTPTITAGVSFECEHFDEGYFVLSSSSCDTKTAQQMGGRIRNVSSHTYHVWMDLSDDTFTEDPNLVRVALTNQYLFESSSRMLNKSPVGFVARVGGDGCVEYAEEPFIDLLVENVVNANRSKNRFGEMFIDQVVETGAKVQFIEGDSHLFTRTEVLSKAHLGQAQEIVKAPPLDDISYQLIHDAKTMRTNKASDISAVDMNSYIKTFIMRFWSMQENEVTVEVAQQMHERAVIVAAKFLTELRNCVVWFDSRKALCSLAEIPETKVEIEHWIVRNALVKLDMEHIGKQFEFDHDKLIGACKWLEELFLQTRPVGWDDRNKRLGLWHMVKIKWHMPLRSKSYTVILALIKMFLFVSIKIKKVNQVRSYSFIYNQLFMTCLMRRINVLDGT